VIRWHQLLCWSKDIVAGIKGIVGLLWQLFVNASPKAQFAILSLLVGAVIGIPMSPHGLTWHQAKTVKQSTDCMTDAYIAFDTALNEPHPHLTYSAHLNARMDNMLEPFGKSFTDCRQAVDPSMSSVDFLKQQYQRQQDG